MIIKATLTDDYKGYFDHGGDFAPKDLFSSHKYKIKCSITAAQLFSKVK